MNYLPVVFASTIFFSSFLLFQIQPLIFKQIANIQVNVLFLIIPILLLLVTVVGYSYTYFLKKLRLGQQMILQVLLIIATVFFLKEYLIFSSINFSAESATSLLVLATTLLKTLLLTFGLPFILLITTVWLLPYWYSKFITASPLKLFKLFSSGAIFGLLSYPFLLSNFPLAIQWNVWIYGVVSFVVILLSILYLLLLLPKKL